MSLWLSRAVSEVSVYRSTCSDVFANLALEQWLMDRTCLRSKRILLLWRNAPSVVIGRHQNPWLETDTLKLREKSICLARRPSGGGAVYHDLGNLNCTLLTHKTDYKRKRNLQLVCDAINQRWQLGLSINKRDDIMLDNKKVSGSAAKLARDKACHHFTLLLSVDRMKLAMSLHPNPQFYFTSGCATPSIRTSVTNLTSHTPDIDYDAVCNAISNQFFSLHGRDEQDRNVEEVDPLSESSFPGITAMRLKLQTWQWIYGKTPAFTVSLDIPGNQHLVCQVVKGNISAIEGELKSDLIGLPFNEIEGLFHENLY